MGHGVISGSGLNDPGASARSVLLIKSLSSLTPSKQKETSAMSACVQHPRL